MDIKRKLAYILGAIVLVAAAAMSTYTTYQDYKAQNVLIETDTKITNVGKVSSELVTYRMKVVFTDDQQNQDTTPYMKTGDASPSEALLSLMQLALKDNFSYDSVLSQSMTVVVETSVIYVGDKGVAQKVIDSRGLVFHNGTTIKEILADVSIHTKMVNDLYKAKHSYLAQ